jgi:hypothetical protein
MIIKREIGNLSKINAGFMWWLQENTRISMDLMIFNWKIACSLSIKNKHLKQYFKWRLIVDEAMQLIYVLWLAIWSDLRIWIWTVNSRKIARWCQDSRFQSISPKEKIFLVPTFSLSPLCLRTSKCLNMGREVGTMQFRVQGE